MSGNVEMEGVIVDVERCPSLVILKQYSSNQTIIDEEKAKKEKKEYLPKEEKKQKSCFSIIATVLSALALIFLFISTLNTLINYPEFSNMFLLKFSNSDRVGGLNSAFFAPKVLKLAPKVIPNEFSQRFSHQIQALRGCKRTGINMYGFFGESGIGKTTMLRDALRSLQPNPFLLLEFFEDTQWSSLGYQIGISTKDEVVTFDLFKSTLYAYLDLLQLVSSENCPLIVIDNANRNIALTNKVVELVRDKQFEIALLLISSDGELPKFNSAGGRLFFEELLEPSLEFGVQYLKEINITDQTLVSKILEITGSKILYLHYVSSLAYKQSVEEIIESLVPIIYEPIQKVFTQLPPKITRSILSIANSLIREPQQKIYFSDLPEHTSHQIVTSNLIRVKKLENSKAEIDFQNRAVKKYFETYLDNLLESFGKRQKRRELGGLDTKK